MGKAGPGVFIFFFWEGHGDRSPDTSGTSPDGQMYIHLPYQFQQDPSTFMNAPSYAPLFAQGVAAGATIQWIAGTCHSQPMEFKGQHNFWYQQLPQGDPTYEGLKAKGAAASFLQREEPGSFLQNQEKFLAEQTLEARLSEQAKQKLFSFRFQLFTQRNQFGFFSTQQENMFAKAFTTQQAYEKFRTQYKREMVHLHLHEGHHARPEKPKYDAFASTIEELPRLGPLKTMQELFTEGIVKDALDESKKPKTWGEARSDDHQTTQTAKHSHSRVEALGGPGSLAVGACYTGERVLLPLACSRPDACMMSDVYCERTV